jgi:hypothetical protein
MGLSQQEQAILLVRSVSSPSLPLPSLTTHLPPTQMISTKGPGPIPKQSRTLTKPAAFTLATASRSTFKKSHRQPLQPLVPIKRSTSKAYFEDGSKGFESFERPVQSYEHPMKKMAALVEGWKKEEGVVEKEEEIKVSQDAEEMKLSDLDTGAWRREAEEKRVAEKTNAQLDATLQEIEDRIAVIKRDDEERWAAILEFRRQERLRMVPTITLTPPDDDDTWDEELYHYSKDPQDRKLLHPYWKQPQDIIILQTKMIIVKIEEEEEEYDLSQDDLSLYEFPFQHRRNYERSTSPPDYIPERNSSSAGFY